MRRVAAAVAAIALSFTLALIGPFAVPPAAASAPAPSAAALAEAPPSSCANQSLCGYGRINYGTDLGYEYMPARSFGTCENVGLRNQWSSLYNNGGRTVRVYKGLGCTGSYLTFYNGQNVQNMYASYPTYNDQIESVMWR